MNFFRYHWFDVGLVIAILLFINLYVMATSGMDLLLWLSLGSLFFHQFEEWRFPGTFLQMANRVMFKSDMPDRFPLNANSGMLINVVLGWGSYFLAALFWEQVIWLAVATILVSIGNIFAHTIIFNIKGKTLYNPGLLTCWLFFVPIVYFFFDLVLAKKLASQGDWLFGIALGITLNYFGVYKMIIWLSNKNTPYVFPQELKNP